MLRIYVKGGARGRSDLKKNARKHIFAIDSQENTVIRLSIKNITGPDPVKFTESTEGSGPGLRNLSENDDLSVPECSSGSGSK